MSLIIFFCFIIGAPIDGDFGEWEAWGQCSHTCGESFRSRKRKCDNPSPQNGGRDCDLRWSTEIIRCNVTNCPGISVIQNLGKILHSVYHLPNFLIAGYLSSNFCSFLVQGSWSSWGDYGSCSKTCGGGNKTRDRDCTALTNEASEEAPHCPGDAYQTIECNTNECPGEF